MIFLQLKQNLKEYNKYYNDILSKPNINKILNIGLYLFFFIVPLCYLQRFLDNDTWFLLNSGRYIQNNGFAIIEPFSIHQDMNFIFQQWLTDYYFWIIYNKLGQAGLIICIYLEAVVLNILLFTLLNIIGKNKIASFFALVFFNMYAGVYYVTRPQVTTMISLVLLLICLEKYAQSNNKKWLYFLPLISVLEINLHSSIWWMLFVFTLPYIFDFINIKAIGLKGDRYYNKVNIIVADIIMFICGFINPYTYKSVFYLFNSLSSEYKNTISELSKFSLGYQSNVICFIIILLLMILYCYEVFKKDKIYNSRYVYLFVGCTILFFYALRNIIFFAIALSVIIVVLTKDYIKINNVCKFLIGIFLSIICILFLVNKINYDQYSASQNQQKEVKDYILEQVDNPENINLYTSFNDGPFFEFFGFKCYMDARMEVFTKKINGQYDYFDECSKVSCGSEHYNTIFDKYDFDYYVIDKNTTIYTYIKKDNNYESVFSNQSYDLFIKKR